MVSIYKLLGAHEWRDARAAGLFAGSAVDRADGYIHFSSGEQLSETARRHFRNRADLVCLEIDADELGEPLRWEASRGGDLFPHLYAPLPLSAVRRAWPVSLGEDGSPSVDPPAP